jgi:hypothetical protein
VQEIAQLYDQREKEWLPDAVADALGQLRKLIPDPADADYELHIELTARLDPEDQRFWDVGFAPADRLLANFSEFGVCFRHYDKPGCLCD